VSSTTCEEEQCHTTDIESQKRFAESLIYLPSLKDALAESI